MKGSALEVYLTNEFVNIINTIKFANHQTDSTTNVLVEESHKPIAFSAFSLKMLLQHKLFLEMNQPCCLQHIILAF